MSGTKRWPISPALLVLGLLASCAEPQSPGDNPIRVHPASWMNPQSADFHGTRVAMDTPEACKSCHGDDYMGDPPAPSCYECHDGPSGHPSDWPFPPSPFHGDQVAAGGSEQCQTCHGADYMGGWAEVSCFDCHDGPSGHPSGWAFPPSPFHGDYVRANDALECRSCHGVDWRGGWSEVSCYTCHNGPSGHPENWALPSAPLFHGSVVVADGPEPCQDCHGADYLGGWTGVSCYDCHDGPGGP